MRHLLRNLSISSYWNRKSLIGIVAISTAGSGLLYATTNKDSKTTVSVSFPVPFRESLSLPLGISQELLPRPAFLSLDYRQFGLLPLFSPRVGSVPPEDIKEAPIDIGNGQKPCCGCLGRDTIANAAAKVGPAVVNLSVPRGSYGITTGKSIGSGTIIDKDGTILTCAHVVVDFQGMRTLSKGKVNDSS